MSDIANNKYVCEECGWKGKYEELEQDEDRWYCPECSAIILKRL